MKFILVVYITMVNYLGEMDVTMTTLPNEFGTKGNCQFAASQVSSQFTFTETNKPKVFSSSSSIKTRTVEGVCIEVVDETEEEDSE